MTPLLHLDIEKPWWHAVPRGKLIIRMGQNLRIPVNKNTESVEILNGKWGHVIFFHKYVGSLKRKGCEFTSTNVKTEIEKQFAALGISQGVINVEAEPVPREFPDTDPQVLHVHSLIPVIILMMK